MKNRDTIMNIRIYDRKKRKMVVIGVVKDGIFSKKVIPKKHLMRIYNAYGIQEEAFDILKNLDVHTVHILTPKKTFVSGLEDWFSSHVILTKHGHGQQRFLPLRYMEQNEKAK